jgi:hypothetical protein
LVVDADASVQYTKEMEVSHLEEMRFGNFKLLPKKPFLIAPDLEVMCCA